MARCKVCKALFERRRMTQKVCLTVECAKAFAEQERARKAAKLARQERQATRAKILALKPKGYWLARAQRAFNAFIRFRDRDLLCICCSRPLGQGEVGGSYDAGHFRSTGTAPHLRFDESNCHAQRKQCNRYGGGRAVDYRLGLIERIGIAEVERLEADQSERRYTIADYQQIEATYKRKLDAAKRAAQSQQGMDDGI